MTTGDRGEISQNNHESSIIENGSEGVVGRINQLKRQRIESGELVETPTVTYHFPFLTDERFLSSPKKDKLKELADASNTVSTSQEAIEDLEIKGNITITRLIPNDEHKMGIIPGLGIGGRAIANNEVQLYFSPDDQNVLESLAKWNDRQIAHELTHVARQESGNRGRDLLDAMIDEGLATYNEEHWKGKYEQTPWGHALTQEQLKEEWIRAQDELFVDLDGQRYEGWFFGINNTHQRWSGYSLGNAIVNSYFQTHSDARIAEVIRMDSKDILKESRFNLL